MDQGKKRGGTRGAAAAAAATPSTVSGPSAKRGRWPSEKDRTVLGVAFSREGTAPQLSLSRDYLEVAGDGKGYRMARANTGVREGHWYFELEVLPPPAGLPQGHVRVGWAAVTSELQGPVGYDQWSYGFRDVGGSRVHKSERCDDYGSCQGFGVGDVIGCCVYLAPPTLGPLTVGGLVGQYIPPASANSMTHNGMPNSSGGSNNNNSSGGGSGEGGPPELAHLDASTSHVRFYVNGVDQGVAFDKIPYRTYYPAVSCYGGGRVRANFGPNWLKPPPGAASAAAATGRPGSRNATTGPTATNSSSNSGTGGSQPAMPLLSHGGGGVAGGGGAPPSAAHVGAIRAVAELKPLPKLEAAEHARAIMQRRSELESTVSSSDVSLGQGESNESDPSTEECAPAIV